MMSGSMALLADGWHMATHTLALGVSALAYWLARRWAHDQRYSFGTGKVGELAGFASALALAIVAIGIAVESAGRLFEPRNVDYREAIVVAVLGLVVNLVSAALLHDGHGHAHGHDHVHGDGHEYHADNNLRSAYMHVLADALTSVLAIVALAAGMLAGCALARPRGRPDRRGGDPALVVDPDPRHLVGAARPRPRRCAGQDHPQRGRRRRRRARHRSASVAGRPRPLRRDRRNCRQGSGRRRALQGSASAATRGSSTSPSKSSAHESVAALDRLHPAHFHRRRRDPGGDGPPADLHLRDGRIMGQQLGQPQDQPDARRLVQPQPFPPRLDLLRRSVAGRAQMDDRAALLRRLAGRNRVGNPRKFADDHRPLPRGDRSPSAIPATA